MVFKNKLSVSCGSEIKNYNWCGHKINLYFAYLIFFFCFIFLLLTNKWNRQGISLALRYMVLLCILCLWPIPIVTFSCNVLVWTIEVYVRIEPIICMHKNRYGWAVLYYSFVVLLDTRATLATLGIKLDKRPAKDFYAGEIWF